MPCVVLAGAAVEGNYRGQQVGASCHAPRQYWSRCGRGPGDPARGPAMASLPVHELFLTGLEEPLAQPAGGKSYTPGYPGRGHRLEVAGSGSMAGLGWTFRTGLWLGLDPSPVDAMLRLQLGGGAGRASLPVPGPAFGGGELKKLRIRRFLTLALGHPDRPDGVHCS